MHQTVQWQPPWYDPSCSSQQAFETLEKKEDDENGSAPVNRGSAPVAQAVLEKLGSELGGVTKDPFFVMPDFNQYKCTNNHSYSPVTAPMIIHPVHPNRHSRLQKTKKKMKMDQPLLTEKMHQSHRQTWKS